MDRKDAEMFADTAELIDQAAAAVDAQPDTDHDECPKCNGRKWKFMPICRTCEMQADWRAKDRRVARACHRGRR